MGCSREVAGVHIQQNAAANANCPSETEPVDLLIPELAELLTVRAASTHPHRAVRLKINTAFAITCELRALFVGADFHLFYLIGSSLSILFWMNR